MCIYIYTYISCIHANAMGWDGWGGEPPDGYTSILDTGYSVYLHININRERERERQKFGR